MAAAEGIPASAAYLDLAEPDLSTVALELAAADHRSAVVVPLLFTSAFHATVDVPQAIAAAATISGLDLLVASVLGTGPDVGDLLTGLMAEAGVTADHSVLLYAVGSSDAAANDDVHALAAALSATREGGVRVGFGTAEPRASAVLAELREPIAIVPLFLAPGLLLEPMEAMAAERGWVMTSRWRSGRHRSSSDAIEIALPRCPYSIRFASMAIAPEHAGRSYPPPPRTRCRPRRSPSSPARIGDDNPAYFTESPVAPPTFVAVLAADAWEAMFADEELGLALRRIVHGDQRFSYARALRAGDRVQAILTIDKVRSRGSADIISSSVRVETVGGELVCTAEATFFHSHEAAA